MAKGDVTMRFDAETAAFVAKVTAARQEMDKTANTARNLGDETAKAGDKMSDGMGKGASAAKGMSETLGTVTAAVTAVTFAVNLAESAFDGWLKRSQEKADTLYGRITTINSALGGSGQQRFAPEVEANLDALGRKDIGRFKYNPKEVHDIFGAVSAAVGVKATANQKVNAADAGEFARGAGLDMQQATNVAITRAAMERFREVGLPEEEFTRQANELSISIGGVPSDRQFAFYASAKDKSLARKLLAASAMGEVPARGLTSIMEATEHDYDPLEIRKLKRESHKDADAARKLAISAIPKENRLQAMISNPDLFPDKERNAVRRLVDAMNNAPEIRSLDKEFKDRMWSRDTYVDLGVDAQNADAAIERNKLGTPNEAASALQKQTAHRLSESNFRANHPIFSNLETSLPALDWPKEKIMKGLIWAGEGSTGPVHVQHPEVPVEHRYEGAISHHFRLLRQSFDRGFSEMSSAFRLRRDTSLSNDSEGQK